MKKGRTDTFVKSNVTHNTSTDKDAVLVNVRTTETGKTSCRLSFTSREHLYKNIFGERMFIMRDADVESLYKTLKKHFEG